MAALAMAAAAAVVVVMKGIQFLGRHAVGPLVFLACQSRTSSLRFCTQVSMYTDVEMQAHPMETRRCHHLVVV